MVNLGVLYLNGTIETMTIMPIPHAKPPSPLAHLLAGGLVIGASVVLTILTYLVLLILSLLARMPLGGPLALPFWTLAVLAASVLTVVTVLAPVTTMSALLCRGPSLWARAAQIPVAAVLLFVEMLLLGLLHARHTGQSPSQGLTHGLTAGALLLIPLGLYWWCLQVVDGLMLLGTMLWRAVWRRLRQ